jgi:hypothetical protein
VRKTKIINQSDRIKSHKRRVTFGAWGRLAGTWDTGYGVAGTWDTGYDLAGVPITGDVMPTTGSPFMLKILINT